MLIGLSGGADSMCLAHLMRRLGVDSVAAYLHHSLRPEADSELEACERWCQSIGLPFVAGKADVPTLAKHHKLGIEEAGRMARYEFFRQSAMHLQCGLIATGHTQDDHIESILLHLARGSGLLGVSGMAVRRDNIVRPLLSFTRAETRSYCSDNDLPFHDDPMNEDEQFARVRMRLRVIPELRKVHPGFDEAIVRFAGIAREEDSLLDSIAAAALESSAIALNGPLEFLTADVEFAFSLALLTHHPEPIVRRGVRMVVRALGVDPEFGWVEGWIRAAKAEPKGSMTTEGGAIVLEWERGEAHVRRLQVDSPDRCVLQIPGETISDSLGWQMHAEILNQSSIEFDSDNLLALLDASKVKGEPHLRSARDGDTIVPLGMSGSKSVMDAMKDRKLTLAARRRLPIVCDFVGPIWIPGVCIADRVKLDKQSGNILAVQIAPVVGRATMSPSTT